MKKAMIRRSWMRELVRRQRRKKNTMRRKKRRRVETMMKYQTNTVFHLRDAQDALSLRQVECGFLTPSKVFFLVLSL